MKVLEIKERRNLLALVTLVTGVSGVYLWTHFSVHAFSLFHSNSIVPPPKQTPPLSSSPQEVLQEFMIKNSERLPGQR